MKTNQSTCMNLRPIVRKGEKVTKGQTLVEGYATEDGELALGRNLLVAFMPWKGYNFEDAIVISERVAREDMFTSIHIDEYIMEVRDTKRGLEELTSDIPNVSEEATKDLDENGLIRIGAGDQGGRHPHRQDHAERGDRSDPRKRNCCAPSSATRPVT